MFRQERIEKAFIGYAPADMRGVIARILRAAADAVMVAGAPVVEAIAGPWYIEQLEPRNRGRMSARENGESDAYFYGIQ